MSKWKQYEEQIKQHKEAILVLEELQKQYAETIRARLWKFQLYQTFKSELHATDS